MKPPPPMFPAAGCTTASAKPVATAASTALPPRRRISAPAWEASWCTLTTIARLAWVGRKPAARAGWARASAASQQITAFKIRCLRRTLISNRGLSEKRGLADNPLGCNERKSPCADVGRPATEASLGQEGQSNQDVCTKAEVGIRFPAQRFIAPGTLS